MMTRNYKKGNAFAVLLIAKYHTRVILPDIDMDKKQMMLNGPDKLFPDTFPNDIFTSDDNGVQHVFEFDNGYKLSVIKGKYTYSGAKGLWEIAPMDSDRSFIGQALLGWGDDVLGHLSLTEVYKYCIMVSEL